MTDKEQAVMDVLWPILNQLQWSVSQLDQRQREIIRIRNWLPQCTDKETRRYYRKWLDFFEKEATRKRGEIAQRTRVSELNIETPPSLPAATIYL